MWQEPRFLYSQSGPSNRRSGLSLIWRDMGLFLTAVLIAGWVGPDASAQPPTGTASHNTKARLESEASPYLREAAHQPVHWYPWGKEAFQTAQEKDLPILLDIGAVWCHWCHVMDVESYENPEIANLINQHFIAIKVDMDERPDIDRRYQEAVRALSGQSGWPLTAFLTPQGQVFFGGTYFPPRTQNGRTGLLELLPAIVRAYGEGRADIMASAVQLSKALTHYGMRSVEKGSVSDSIVESVIDAMQQEFDRENGGFGTRSKFPSGSAIELALARYFVHEDSQILEMATKSLDAMALGGMYDHLGGGFFRYATDPEWKVPHFEKMNYDNAELLINYLHAYQVTGKDLYRDTALGIISYIREVLSDQERGGFYAHQDADMTRQDDGDYYTWTVQEIRSVLPSDEAEVILRYYDVKAKGEMHKNPAKNALRVDMPPEKLAQDLKVPSEIVARLIHQGRERLREARSMRQAPLVDRTLYVDRNALVITAYLEAFQVLGEDSLKRFALKTLDELLNVAYRKGQGMYHAISERRPRVSGLLNDQVQMASAALKAFEVTGDPRYRDIAQDLMAYSIRTFWDNAKGGFVDRAPEDRALAALGRTMKDIDDSPYASPNAVAAMLLHRLEAVTNDDVFGRTALATLEAFAGSAPRMGRYAAGYALAVHYYLHGSAQAVIIGTRGDQRTHELWEAAARTYRPGKLVTMYDPGSVELAKLPPAVVGAVRAFGKKGKPRAYICAGATCAPPTTEPDEVVKMVRSYGKFSSSSTLQSIP